MRNISLNDITISTCMDLGLSLSFKEKVEMAKIMDRLNYSVISLPELSGAKGDELLVKTLAGTLKNSSLSIETGLDKEKLHRAWECVSKAKAPRLNVSVPVSAVQMEYLCGMKGPKALELITNLVKEASGLCSDTEFTALDATRAEFDFLAETIKAAIAAGAKTVTLSDTAGVMLPDEIADFIRRLTVSVPEIRDVNIGVEISNILDMSTACAFAAVTEGVSEIRTSVSGESYPGIENVVKLIKRKGENAGVETSVIDTELSRGVKQMEHLLGKTDKNTVIPSIMMSEDETLFFDSNDDIAVITDACRNIGYELSEEDAASVYEAFLRVATKKEKVSKKELEVIVANSALQVKPTYKLVSYVLNSGNIISATANIKLLKDDKEVSGISSGDGPIDAAFRAVEQIVGHHYELDDFQIQSVTEGKEAVGQAVVKLRADGTLYSGTGISTDIIGASVRAYINAINKIVYVEE